MKNSQTAELMLPVSEFKAKCLDILGQLGNRTITHVTVTRHGRPVAELFPPRSKEADVRSLFAVMGWSVVVPPGVDPTEPVIDMSQWNVDPLPSSA